MLRADGWPAIDEPELVRRLGLEHEPFVAMIKGFADQVGVRPFGDAAYERALGYPWARPSSSFLLDGDDVVPLEAAPRAATDGRFALLAFGSNAAPETLARKFAHLPGPERRIAVEAGDLYDFDVAAAALPAAYGAFPATLVASTGTAVRAAVLWVTPTQLTTLAWTEVSYLLGRLEPVRFEPDVPGAARPNRVLAFVSRWGALAIDGAHAPLAALPARGRTAPAWSQEDLLERLARAVLAPDASARDLVAAMFADFPGTLERAAPELGQAPSAFDAPGWTRYPA